MDTKLVEMLAWIQVELEAARPNLDQIKSALNTAMEDAAKVLIDKECIAASRRRIAMVAGCENPLGEMQAILGNSR